MKKSTIKTLERMLPEKQVQKAQEVAEKRIRAIRSTETSKEEADINGKNLPD